MTTQRFSPVLVYDDADKAMEFLKEAFDFDAIAVSGLPAAPSLMRSWRTWAA